ncbi:MAG: hypothetical protein GJT30_03110 [Geobacter sp.]|nr:hypothetical protein [Geobacter sp.]
MTEETSRGHIIDTARLPKQFPTHRHEETFWAHLGRAVATFGFLEEVLAKAIFAFTATRPYNQSEIDEAFEQWLPKLERALTDPLGGLIDSFGKAVRDYPDEAITNLSDLLSDLKKAASMRNILCHGSWRLPDSQGASVPFFVNRQKEVFETAMDCAYLDQVQRHTAEIACSVINTVTNMGWQFPGSMGPGKPIWRK